MQRVQQKDSLLQERGQEQLLAHALQAGETVLCAKCEMLVPAARWEQHRTQWCAAAAAVGSGSEGHTEGIVQENKEDGR